MILVNNACRRDSIQKCLYASAYVTQMTYCYDLLDFIFPFPYIDKIYCSQEMSNADVDTPILRS